MLKNPATEEWFCNSRFELHFGNYNRISAIVFKLEIFFKKSNCSLFQQTTVSLFPFSVFKAPQRSSHTYIIIKERSTQQLRTTLPERNVFKMAINVSNYQCINNNYPFQANAIRFGKLFATHFTFQPKLFQRFVAAFDMLLLERIRTEIRLRSAAYGLHHLVVRFFGCYHSGQIVSFGCRLSSKTISFSSLLAETTIKTSRSNNATDSIDTHFQHGFWLW